MSEPTFVNNTTTTIMVGTLKIINVNSSSNNKNKKEKIHSGRDFESNPYYQYGCGSTSGSVRSKWFLVEYSLRNAKKKTKS